ncbi:MAG: DUF2188 domain-containing protein [Candidatus Symbiothrix sp.]|nr:DUF2188 domain-containing protein [Candidatus Symbiothrix sp.]
MANRTNHVVPSSTGWAVRKSGASRASRNFSTQREAIRYGTQLSRTERTELFIHRENGMIRERNSYGNDPCPPRDKR